MSFSALSLFTLVLTSSPTLGTEPPPATPIYGGDVVASCGWPNVVSMGGGCSGTLIHPELVIYAAHCGDEVPWIGFMDDIQGPGRMVVPVECKLHPVGNFGAGSDFAFCRLPEPITDIPITPPLVGCDAEDKLRAGQKVTLIGFGMDENDVAGIKRAVETEINSFAWDEVLLGNAEKHACYGDSGGPAMVQLDDGTWRVFGVTSWGQPGCGHGTYYSLVANGLEWFESASGLDLTPCTDSRGVWEATPACTGFATGNPGEGSGMWDDCSFPAGSGLSQTCGPPVDLSPDITAPVATIANPSTGTQINGVMGDSVTLTVEVEATDVGWGTAEMTLNVLNATGDKVLATLVDHAAPFHFESLTFKTGVWTLEAIAKDHAGNVSEPDRAIIGINVVPPEPAEDDDDDDDDDDTTTTATTSDEPVPTTGGPGEGESSSSDSAEMTDDSAGAGGCGCRSEPTPGAAVWGLGLFGLAFARRRRQLALVGTLAVASHGCSDDTATATTDDTTGDTTAGEPDSSSGTTELPTTTATTETTTDATETTEAASTGPVGPACGNGLIEADELCDDGNLVHGDGCNADCVPSGSVVEVLPIDRPVQGLRSLTQDGAGNLIAVTAIATPEDTVDAWIGAFAPDGTSLWTDVYASEPGLEAFLNSVVVQGDEIVAVGGADYDSDYSEALVLRYSLTGTRTGTTVTELAGRRVATRVAVSDAGLAIFSEVDLDAKTTSLRAVSAAGETQWTMDLATNDQSARLSRTHDGAFVVVHSLVVSAHKRDIRVVKFDAEGTIEWQRVHGDPLTEYWPIAITVAPTGEIYVCGSGSRTSYVDTVVFGLGANGSRQWFQRPHLPGVGWDECTSLAVDGDGSIIFAGTAFRDPSADMWYGRLSPAGEVRWTQTYTAPGLATENATGVVILQDGHLMLGGRITLDSLSHAALVRTTG